MQRTMEVLLCSIPGDVSQVEMARHNDSPPEDGRIGSADGPEDGTSSILGFMGRCIAHVAATSSRHKSCTTCRKGQRLGVWVSSQEAAERLDRCGFC